MAFLRSMLQLDHPSTPAGGVPSVHLQQVGLELLCVVLETLSEGANQTCCIAFVFHQLNGVSWKWHTHTHTWADKSEQFSARILQLYVQTRVPMLVHTIDSGVGLDKHLPSFLPKQYRLPETQEVVSAAVADGGVAVIESPASVHICCWLQHLPNSGIGLAMCWL